MVITNHYTVTKGASKTNDLCRCGFVRFGLLSFLFSSSILQASLLIN